MTREAVLEWLPEICPDYLTQILAQHNGDHQQTLTHVLDLQDKGVAYPRRGNLLKRKRSKSPSPDDAELEELRKTYEQPVANRRPLAKGAMYMKQYSKTAKTLLMSAFPRLYAQDFNNFWREHNRIYPSYLALHAEFSKEEPNRRLNRKKVPTQGIEANGAFENSPNEADRDAWAEFTAAKRICQARDDEKTAEQRQQQAEADNFAQAKAARTIKECGCCFDEFAMNRMVTCGGDNLHWFCWRCARMNAETQVGMQKYDLKCMSVDGCNGSFPYNQRSEFLDKKLIIALDRIEQEAMLRLAGIENLETCPFCPYAAEYPSVSENREFRCEGPECMAVSCRLCRKETHIPKTCQEAALDEGYSARHHIEEAMSAALIRNCNKCGTPFIKENGCNKMTCTRNGCFNVQCYVCSKSCDYGHFNDESRGGKPGNCPLFDIVEERHDEEVQAAAAKARKEAAEANPDIAEEFLEIRFSDKVKQDENRRKATDVRQNPHLRMQVAAAEAAQMRNGFEDRLAGMGFMFPIAQLNAMEARQARRGAQAGAAGAAGAVQPAVQVAAQQPVFPPEFLPVFPFGAAPAVPALPPVPPVPPVPQQQQQQPQHARHLPPHEGGRDLDADHHAAVFRLEAMKRRAKQELQELQGGGQSPRPAAAMTPPQRGSDLAAKLRCHNPAAPPPPAQAWPVAISPFHHPPPAVAQPDRASIARRQVQLAEQYDRQMREAEQYDRQMREAARMAATAGHGQYAQPPANPLGDNYNYLGNNMNPLPNPLQVVDPVQLVKQSQRHRYDEYLRAQRNQIHPMVNASPQMAGHGGQYALPVLGRPAGDIVDLTEDDDINLDPAPGPHDHMHPA
ncbi:hypothetical protein B0H63DRAFT_98036 [Podospora didyma]|uniref:RING-type domain-containing protein n=1 Tax=Podospora didyma TaxID=330526 RepID=A0AAE0U385_9PEZI|nr:hypothetical protein B0H63DRAFT_98036 [Podospora didyma]